MFIQYESLNIKLTEVKTRSKANILKLLFRISAPTVKKKKTRFSHTHPSFLQSHDILEP
jgi:hypothetical protein